MDQQPKPKTPPRDPEERAADLAWEYCGARTFKISAAADPADPTLLQELEPVAQGVLLQVVNNLYRGCGLEIGDSTSEENSFKVDRFLEGIFNDIEIRVEHARRACAEQALVAKRTRRDELQRELMTLQDEIADLEREAQ